MFSFVTDYWFTVEKAAQSNPAFAYTLDGKSIWATHGPVMETPKNVLWRNMTAATVYAVFKNQQLSDTASELICLGCLVFGNHQGRQLITEEHFSEMCKHTKMEPKEVKLEEKFGYFKKYEAMNILEIYSKITGVPVDKIDDETRSFLNKKNNLFGLCRLGQFLLRGVRLKLNTTVNLWNRKRAKMCHLAGLPRFDGSLTVDLLKIFHASSICCAATIGWILGYMRVYHGYSYSLLKSRFAESWEYNGLATLSMMKQLNSLNFDMDHLFSGLLIPSSSIWAAFEVYMNADLTTLCGEENTPALANFIESGNPGMLPIDAQYCVFAKAISTDVLPFLKADYSKEVFDRLKTALEIAKNK